MPSRTLPDSHLTRDKAFQAARAKYPATPAADRLLTPTHFTELLDPALATSLASRWFKERGEAQSALSAQTAGTDTTEPLFRQLALTISHYFQTLNNTVERDEFAPSIRPLYALAVSDGTVPVLAAESDLTLWAGRVATGESARTAAGGPPLAFPSAAQVAEALATWQEANLPQSTAKDHYAQEQKDVIDLVEAVDLGIERLWNAIEYQLSEAGLRGPALRRRAREWGVIYTPNPGEAPEIDPTPSTTPTPQS